MKYLVLAAAMAMQLSSPLPANAAACEYPNKDAKVLVATPPNIPDADLKHPHVKGPALVFVGLDAKGKVVQTKIASSSGDPAVDRAAIDAARSSTYAPATRNCEGVPGRYLFKVQVGP